MFGPSGKSSQKEDRPPFQALEGALPASGQQAGDLALIAQANEQIKQVRRLAEEISLIATNAMLVARRTGDNAIGFRVVARELRVTSDRMASIMEGLSGLIYQLVLAVARCCSMRHRTRSLGAAARGSVHAGNIMGAALGESRNKCDGCLCSVRALAQRLDAIIQRTGRQCDNGIVIARAASIEAAYGGNMQPLLRQIAQHFEASIADLAAYIRVLRQQLEGMAA